MFPSLFFFLCCGVVHADWMLSIPDQVPQKTNPQPKPSENNTTKEAQEKNYVNDWMSEQTQRRRERKKKKMSERHSVRPVHTKEKIAFIIIKCLTNIRIAFSPHQHTNFFSLCKKPKQPNYYKQKNTRK